MIPPNWQIKQRTVYPERTKKNKTISRHHSAKTKIYGTLWEAQSNKFARREKQKLCRPKTLKLISTLPRAINVSANGYERIRRANFWISINCLNVFSTWITEDGVANPFFFFLFLVSLLLACFRSCASLSAHLFNSSWKALS